MEQDTMDFPMAMQAVKEGKCVTKLEWNDFDSYGRLRNGKLMIILKGEWHTWIINDGDVFGEDWIVREILI